MKRQMMWMPRERQRDQTSQAQTADGSSDGPSVLVPPLLIPDCSTLACEKV